MAYGDLSIFLPRAEGDKLNVERARAEGEKRAGYLASMDQFSEELEENQRQFDITAALNERHFAWSSGFEEKKLSQELELGTTRLKQESRRDDVMATYYREQIAMQRKESDYLMEYNTLKFEMERQQLREARGKNSMAWNPYGSSGSSRGGGTGQGYTFGQSIGYKGPYS